MENRAEPYDVQDDPLTTRRDRQPDGDEAATMFTPFFWPDEPDSTYTKVNFGTFKNDYLGGRLCHQHRKASTLPSWLTPQGNPAKYTAAPKSGTWSQGSGYGAALSYGPNSGCAMQQMQRLSTDFASLKTTVSGLVASGETNIPIGLMWGWHTLSPNAPFADGAAYGTPNLTKIIVLMTDGDNTMDDSNDSNGSWYHGYGYVWQNKLGGTTGTQSSTPSPPARPPAPPRSTRV